jgi:hypothetical protein
MDAISVHDNAAATLIDASTADPRRCNAHLHQEQFSDLSVVYGIAATLLSVPSTMREVSYMWVQSPS